MYSTVITHQWPPLIPPVLQSVSENISVKWIIPNVLLDVIIPVGANTSSCFQTLVVQKQKYLGQHNVIVGSYKVRHEILSHAKFNIDC